MNATNLAARPPTKTSLPALQPWQNAMMRAADWTTRPVMIPTSAMPTEAQRSILRRDAAAIDAAMTAGPASSILATVAKLLVAFPATDVGEAGARMRAEAYVEALGDLPGWAVAQAASDWLRGQGCPGANFAFAPSPPQLRHGAERHAGMAQARASTLRRLADAEERVAEPFFSAAHRAEMAARFASLSVTVGKNVELTDRLKRERYAAKAKIRSGTDATTAA